MSANQITVNIDPSQMPARTQDQQTFDNLFALFVQNMPTLGAQFNAGIAAFNAVAAGTAYALPYTIDLTSTVNADPTAGKLRFSSTTQNAATAINLDLLGNDGVDYTSMLDQFDGSTSLVKGQIRLVKQGDPTKFLTFNLTARTVYTGYRRLTLTNTGGSSANPFVQGDAVILKFTRTGDRGDNSFPLLASITVASGATAVDFLTAFTTDYDSYRIEVEGLGFSTATSLFLRFATSSGVDSTGGYSGALAANAGTLTTSSTNIILGGATGTGAVLTIQVTNANSISGTSSGAHKAVAVTGILTTGGSPLAVQGEAVYISGNSLTGFRLYLSSGTFTGGIVRVFGIRNT